MRKIHVKLLLLITVSLSALQVNSQSKLTVDQVYKITLRNSGPIIENEEIKGYYFFYMSDKVDKRTNEYTLQILDANLNKLKDVKFQDSKNIYLVESAFDGNSIVFMFFDDDQNMLDYRLYDLEGKKTFSYSKVLDKKTENYFKTAPKFGGEEEADNQNIYDIPGKGFLTLIPVRDGKTYSYEVNFYASDKRRTWAFNPIEDGKYNQAQYLGSNDSIAFIEVLTKVKMTSKEAMSNLIGINLQNGRKVFEIATQERGTKLFPMNISTLTNSSNYIVMGPYYSSDDRILQDQSDGIGIWTMNNKGKILKSKYISWTNDISKLLKTDERGRIENMGYIYFHKIMQTDDGKIFAIGVGYKKTASALGIATTVLGAMAGGGGGMSVAKMKVTDMLMLQLDQDFKLEKAVIYDKYDNNVELPSGYAFVNPHTLALLLVSTGSFDYSFTQLGKNKSSFISGYTDYEKGKDYRGLAFNSISYYDGNITTDKVTLQSKANRLKVLPAKPGSVLIMEYFKKAKKLELRMEKLN